MDQEDEMLENGMRRGRRQLSPAEKWEVFLEVTTGQLTQADCARKWGVDVSVVIRIRKLAKDGALAAFAAAKPGRPPSVEQVELEACQQECVRLTDTVKEQAIELALLRGRQRSGYSARSLLD